MLNYLSIVVLISFLLCMGGLNNQAYGQWNAFDAMVNQSQDLITTQHNQPCDRAGDALSDDAIDWREDKDGYHANIPVSVPKEADKKQLEARIMDGVLELRLPKKKLKSII